MYFACRSSNEADGELRPVSVVLSSQVTNVASDVSANDPVILNFQYSTVSVIKYCSA